MKKSIIFIMFISFILFSYPIKGKEVEIKKIENSKEYEEIIKNGLNRFEELEEIIEGYEIVGESSMIEIPKQSPESQLHLFKVIDSFFGIVTHGDGKNMVWLIFYNLFNTQIFKQSVVTVGNIDKSDTFEHFTQNRPITSLCLNKT